MTAQPAPYIPHDPGDLITAEDWNQMQVKIKEDIAGQIEDAKEDITHTGVDRADNADKFDQKTPKAWVDELDKRYALQGHDHEGITAYRRFIKEFTPATRSVLLHHKLGRFPLVDVYELLPVVGKAGVDGYMDCKLLFYYSPADADDYGLWVTVYRDRVPLGLPFERVLTELQVQYEDDDTIEDVLNDMWATFMKDPNDKLKFCTAPWIDDCCERHRTVKDLKVADQWNDLYLAIKPRKLGFGGPGIARTVPGTNTPDPAQTLATNAVEVTHLSYDTALVEVDFPTGNNRQVNVKDPLDLMFLMRS
jgi:hypothetical protein